MEKIAIVTDTNACLDYLDYDYDIPILRSIIHLGDDEYIDHEELKAEAFYEKIKSDSTLFPKTSQPPFGKIIETFERLEQEGYTDIIVITISSHMSGIYNSVLSAGNTLKKATVHAFDSKSVAFPQAKMTLTAKALAKEGKSVEAIFHTLHNIRANNHIYFGVDTLAYLVKNGRLSNAQGFIGSMLKIKPLLHISKEGKVENIEKIRTFKKAVNRVIDRFIEETNSLKHLEVFICHAHNQAMSDYIKTTIKEKNPTIKDVLSMPLTPAVGAHAGPGAIGLGYFYKE